MNPLKEFFAITVSGSLYRVESRKELGGSPTVTKIAVVGDDATTPVGYVVPGHGLLSIGRSLIMFTPEGHSMMSSLTSYERDIAQVNTRWWHGGTSAVSALFLDEAEACRCLTEHSDHVLCDPRWLESTKIVLSAIGDKHPDFVITHSQGLALMNEVAVR